MNNKSNYFFILTTLLLIFFGFFALKMNFISNSITGNAIYNQENRTDFDEGTYINVLWDGVDIILSQSNLSGTYISKIFDSGGNSFWDNLTWQGSEPELDIIIAGDTSADIWKSANFGVNWTKVNDDFNGVDGNGITDMAVNSIGEKFILNAQDLWMSNNSGAIWTKVNDNYNGAESNNGIVLGIDNDDNLIIIEGDEEMWKSANFGVNWTKISPDINAGNGNVLGIAIDKSNNIFAADAQADIWKSSDSGATWFLIKDDYNNGDGNGVTDMVADSLDNLFIVYNQDVWKSSDSGAIWTKVNDDFNGADSNNAIVMFTDDNDFIYIIDGSEDLFKSSDSGVTWIRVNSNFNGGGPNIKGAISWRGSSDIVFEVRNCSISDCSDSDFINADLNSLGLTGRYFQYKADFSTTDSSFSPTLQNIVLGYTLQLEEENVNESVNESEDVGESDGENVSDTVDENVSLENNSVRIIQPVGIITNKVGIPLDYVASGINLTCWYEIISLGEVIIDNVSLIDCQNITFNADVDADYVLNLYANNSLGDSYFDSSNFSVETPVIVSEESSFEGNGGGSSGHHESKTKSNETSDVLVPVDVAVDEQLNSVVNSDLENSSVSSDKSLGESRLSGRFVWESLRSGNIFIYGILILCLFLGGFIVLRRSKNKKIHKRGY